MVTNIIEILSGHFGKLTVSRGNKHNYLGMDIKLKNGKVHVEMKDHIAKVIEWGGNQEG